MLNGRTLINTLQQAANEALGKRKKRRHTCKECQTNESLWHHTTTDHKEDKQLEDRKNVGKSSCNSGDRTDQRVKSLIFMMILNQRWDQILTRQKTTTEPTNLPPAHIPSQHLEQHLAIHSTHGWEKNSVRKHRLNTRPQTKNWK
jgi:hypothetical protein